MHLEKRPYSVLILCTGNSARSILGEALINYLGAGRFIGYSAGSSPKGQVHPMALHVLNNLKLPTAGLRSKSWNEFSAPGAPILDFVITVCDNAAGEVCPIWPGHPITGHWSLGDPAAVEGTDSEKLAAFLKIFSELEARIKSLMKLPIATLDPASLKEKINTIGSSDEAP